MSSPPDIDPYETLGVAKDASIAEIRAAHRKRVLKCHPDKIQDVSQRMIAQDEFQRVQQAYELLSDDTRRDRYDKKVRLAELKREVAEQRRRAGESAYAVPRGSGSSREFRGGHVVEERAPMESFLDEESRFTEEPRPTHRKTNDFERRPKAKPEKKTRPPMSGERAAKEQVRESTKASRTEQQRQRDRERQRQAQEKEKYYDYGRYQSDESESESESEYEVYVRMKKQSSSRRAPRHESRSRPTESSRRREPAYDDDQYRGEYRPEYKAATRAAEDYIERTRNGGIPADDYPTRSSRSPQRRRGCDSAEPESSASRRAARSSRVPRERERSSSRNNTSSSYENLESPSRHESKPAKMPSAATQPVKAASSLRPSLLSTRSANASGTGFQRPKREQSSRDGPDLAKMAAESIPRSARPKYESTASSPAVTPEIPQGASPKTTRYTIEPTIIEPPKSSKHRAVSPSRRDRDREPRTVVPPKRASTYDYKSESAPRIEIRSVRPTRPHGDVEYSPRVKREDIKFTQEIRPTEANTSRHYYPEQPHRSAPRRMATYA